MNPDSSQPQTSPTASVYPPASAPAEAPTSSPETPFVFSSAEKPKNPKKKLLPLFLVFILLILLLGSFFVVKKLNLFNRSSSSSSDSSSTSSKEVSLESALFSKLFFLHNPFTTEEKYSSLKDSVFSSPAYFQFSSDYLLGDSFYTNPSSLDNAAKLYLITTYLRQNRSDLFKPFSDFSAPDDFLKQAGYNDSSIAYINDTEGSDKLAIAESEVASLYSEYFSGEVSHETPTEICGRLVYSPEYHFYYKEPPTSCAGFSNLTHHLYVEKYEENDASAYAYVRVNTIKNDALNSDGTGAAVYKTYLTSSAFFDESTSQPITPDSSLLYGYTTSLVPYKITITQKNYESFEAYRFVFKKSGKNYLFETVEKL